MSNAKLVREIRQVYSKVPIRVDVGRLRKALDKGIRELNAMKKTNAVPTARKVNSVPYADTTIKSSVSQPAAIGTGEIVSTITNVKNYDKRSKLQSKIKSIKGS